MSHIIISNAKRYNTIKHIPYFAKDPKDGER